MPANMVKKEPQGSGGNKERLTNVGEHGKKKEPQGSVGIKNSWKYEKDLIIFNTFFNHKAITRLISILYKTF